MSNSTAGTYSVEYHFPYYQIGQDIDGENSLDQSGWSTSLSADGNVIAVGAMKNDGNGSNSGHVRIYKNISGTWVQIGQDIDGEASGDSFGNAVSLNHDGTIVAIGGRDNDGNGNNSRSCKGLSIFCRFMGANRS